MGEVVRAIVILTGLGLMVSCAYYGFKDWAYFAAIITILFAGATDKWMDG